MRDDRDDVDGAQIEIEDIASIMLPAIASPHCRRLIVIQTAIGRLADDDGPTPIGKADIESMQFNVRL